MPFAYNSFTKKLDYYKSSVEHPTIDFTIYVADAARLGTSGATGLELASGTADGTATKKIIDSTANFTADLVNKTVYESDSSSWSWVTAVDSPTQLSTKNNTVVSGEKYVICDAFDNLVNAVSVLRAGYLANIIIQLRNSIYPEDVSISNLPAGAPGKKITLRGHPVFSTRIDGKVTLSNVDVIMNRMFLRNRVFLEVGANIEWVSSATSGDASGIVRKSELTTSTFTSLASGGYNYTYLNDSGKISNPLSLVNLSYNTYLALSVYGGDDSNDGFKISDGTATTTTTNKLIDSTGVFTTTDHLNKTVYNATLQKWAKVTAIDSPTQVTLSHDIMLSGNSYTVSAAKLTGQAMIDSWLAIAAVGASVSVYVSDGTFTDNHQIEGKRFSGSDSITLYGTPQVDYVGLVGTGGIKGTGSTPGTMTDTGLTDKLFNGKLIRPSSGPNAGLIERVDFNSPTSITICGTWDNTPGGTDSYEILSPATIWAGTSYGLQLKSSQKSILIYTMKFKTNSVSGNPITLMGASEIKYTDYCDFLGAGHIIIQGASNFISNRSFFECWDTGSRRALRFINSTGSLSKCKFLRPSDATTGGDLVIIGDLSRVSFGSGCSIDGNTITNVVGVAIDRMGIGIFFSQLASGYNNIRNCDVGVDVTQLSLGSSLAANCFFSGNTTNDYQNDGTSVAS